MTTVVRSPVFIVGVVVGLVLGAAELIGSGEGWRAFVSAGIPIAYAGAVTIAGRRRDSLSVLAGRPIDERAAHVGDEASTWAFGLTAIVLVAAVAWQIAMDSDWAPYAAVAVVMAVAYLGSLFVLQTRHRASPMTRRRRGNLGLVGRSDIRRMARQASGAGWSLEKCTLRA